MEHLEQKSWGERLEETKKIHDEEMERFSSDDHECYEDCFVPNRDVD